MKKAAFQMSLGMVVALVFAVVLLTLAIAWIQGMFSSIEDITYKVTDTAKDLMMSELASGSNKVGLAAPAMLEWGRGESGSFALGIRNSESANQYFTMQIIIEQVNPSTNDFTKVTSGFVYPKDNLLVAPFESNAFNVILQPSPDASPGHYLFRIIVTKQGETEPYGIEFIDINIIS